MVKQAVLNTTVTTEDGSERVEFRPVVGRVEPKGYLVIVTGGLAPTVNLSSLVPVSTGKVGDKIALLAQADGEVILALNSQMSRSAFHEPATVIGKWQGQSTRSIVRFQCLSISINLTNSVCRSPAWILTDPGSNRC